MFQVVMTVSDWLDLSVISDFFKSEMAKINHRAAARRTYKELNKLSDYELRDLGITRDDIYAISYEAYYDDLVKESRLSKRF